MTTYCPSLDNFVALSRPRVPAFSAPAQYIDRIIKQIGERRVELIASEILLVVQESALPDRGPLVSKETAEAAIEFASLLPRSFPTPAVASDPDGEIIFDWAGPSGKMFTVSVSNTGRLAYAGRFGATTRVHGIEQLSTICSDAIIRGVSRAIS